MTMRTGSDGVEAARRGERPQGEGDDDQATLHVEDAGPAREVPVAAVALEATRGKDGVEVADEGHGALVGQLGARAEDEVVGEALARADAMSRPSMPKTSRSRVPTFRPPSGFSV